MAEDHLAAPTPLAEHRTLAAFAGEWSGNARHVYEVLDDHSYTMKTRFSPDAEGWADVLTGVYRRIH
jgi:hypothetical protein